MDRFNWWQKLLIVLFLWPFLLLYLAFFGLKERPKTLLIIGVFFEIGLVTQISAFISGPKPGDKAVTVSDLIIDILVFGIGGVVVILRSSIAKDRVEKKRIRQSTYVSEPISEPVSEPSSEYILHNWETNKIVVCEGCGAKNEVEIGKISKCMYCDSYLMVEDTAEEDES